MTTKEKAEQLEQIAEYCNTELGDLWFILTDLFLYRKDYMTEEFWLQCGVEIEIQHQIAIDMVEDDDIEIPEDIKGAFV